GNGARLVGGKHDSGCIQSRRKTLVTRARDFERSIISRISCAFWRRPAARRWIALLFGASAFSPISDAVFFLLHNSKRGATLTQHSTESKFRSFQISYCTILARATVLARLMQEEKRYELPRFGAFDFALRGISDRWISGGAAEARPIIRVLKAGS